MSMKILVLSPVDDGALDVLDREHDVRLALDAAESDLPDLLADAEIVIFRSGVDLTNELLRGASNLRLALRAGSGLDNIDVEFARSLDIRVEHVPAPAARSVAELTVGLMLACSRRIVEADRSMRRGEWRKREFRGHLLRDKTVGIIGAGSIGSCVGELAVPWGMRALGVIEPETPEAVQALREKQIEVVSFDEAVGQADFLTVHVPLSDATRGLIGASVFEAMKPGSTLVNVARGGVVDEAALLAALQDGSTVRSAALDVHEHETDGVRSPLAELPQVVLTPHIGSMAVEIQAEIGQEILRMVAECQMGTGAMA